MNTNTLARPRGHYEEPTLGIGDASHERGSRAEGYLDGDAIRSELLSYDAGFTHFADFSHLHDLVTARNAGAIVDMALLTAEAERILQRNHRSGVTASDLVGLAHALATQDSDMSAVERIRSAASTRKLSVPAYVSPAHAEICKRIGQESFSISANTPPDSYTAFHNLAKDAKTALLLGDARRLQRVRQAAESLESLTPEMKSLLTPWLQEVAQIAATSEGRQTGGKLPELFAEATALASAIFYQHSWGGGVTYTIYGLFERTNMPDGWNDIVSSLWVRRGYLVYCYEHVNYGGARCWVLVERDGSPGSSPARQKTQEQAGWLFEMSSHGWNDVISSYKVQAR